MPNLYHPKADPDRYNERDFFSVVRRLAYQGLRHVIRYALELYVIMKDPNTPAQQKILIAGTLAYLIMPLDAIPDFLGPVGFADDAAALFAVLQQLASLRGPHIDAEVQRILRSMGLDS